jgi:phage baseplate assembly protein gpV
MNGGESELREGPQIPYSSKVLESGVVPKPRKNSEQDNTRVGLLEATWAEWSQNSLFMSFWRWGDLLDSWKIWNRAPDGWSAADNIHGIFEDYREYLEKSKNPKELLLRKKYVVQRINYERKMARAGKWTKRGSAILSAFLDPLSYLFGAIGGTMTKGIASGMARAGAGKISSSIVHGAATGALFDAAYTTTKKVLGVDVDNPEYHILGGALWGGTLGAVGGMISESAGLARFKVEHGDHGLADYKIFRS